MMKDNNNRNPKLMKPRYSSEDLKLFESLISKKLAQASKELDIILEALSNKREDSTEITLKDLGDSIEVAEKESMVQLAARQRKFITELESASLRIKNGTYGICMITGELIDRARLMVVPHTCHSLAAKLNSPS